MQNLIQILSKARETSAAPSAPNLPKTVAESLFRELRSSGFNDKDIVALSSELIGQLTGEILAREDGQESESVTAH